MSSFTIYDPLSELAAEVAQMESGGGSGGGLPLGGGTLTGDLTLTPPAKVIQSQAPVNPDDVANKAYVDSVVGTGGGPYLPLAGGAMTGAITQPAAPVAATDLANKAYVDSVVNTPGTIPGTSIDAATLPKADDTHFGVVEFDPTGDLVQTAALSGIALIKQPASGVVAVDAGFDSTGKFVSTKIGVVSSSGVLANGTAYTVGNLMLKVNNNSPISLQMQLVSGSGYIAGGAQPYWDTGSAPGVTPVVTGKYIYRAVNSTGYVSLSQRVAAEPAGSTVVSPAFDTSVNIDASESGAGFVEIYNIYVNDNVDDAVYRITVNQINVPTGNSYITVERLST